MAAVAVIPEPRLASLAEDLGTVYALMSEPLGPWAIPPKAGRIRNDMNSKLMPAINAVYSEDRYPPNSPVELRRKNDYSNAYWEVIPLLERKAVAAATSGMDRQVGELIKLGRRLGAGSVPEHLHSLASRIGDRLGGFTPGPSDEDYASRFGQQSLGEKGAPVDQKYERALRASFSKRFWEAVGAELSAPDARDPRELGRQEARDLLRVLSLHRAFSALLVSYAINASRGNVDAQAVVTNAIAASAEFKVDILVHPDHVWRYPPLIALAIEQLGLSDVYGFPEYAIELGRVLSQSWADTALMTLGFAVLLVGVFLSGPLGVTGLGLDIALFGLGAADVGVAAWQAALTYLRDREQDVAATGSAFSARRLAQRPDYSESIMAGAAALIAGIAFVYSGVRLGTRMAAGKAATGAPRVPPPRSTDPAAARVQATEGKATRSRRTRTPEDVSSGEAARRRSDGPAKPPARPRWDEGPPRTRPPARAAVGSRPAADVLPDAVSRGQPVGERFIGGRGLNPDTPVASGSGRGSSMRPSRGRATTGTGSAEGPRAAAGSRANRRAGAGSRERATQPGSKKTGPEATDRLASSTMTTGTQEYSMINAVARAREVSNPANLRIPAAYPYTRLRRPVGRLDPVLLDIARNVRARVAGTADADFFKNVAVARVRVGPNGPVRYIAAVNTPGREFVDLGRGFDSELLLLGYAEGRNTERVSYILEALYTERAPCQTCTSNLAAKFSEIPIFYSVPNESRIGGMGRARELMDRYRVGP